jgi:hypothetical protein
MGKRKEAPAIGRRGFRLTSIGYGMGKDAGIETSREDPTTGTSKLEIRVFRIHI